MIQKWSPNLNGSLISIQWYWYWYIC